MADVAIDVQGVRELRTALRRMGTQGGNKALRVAHKNTAKFVEGRSKGQGTAQQVKAARAILGKGSTDTAVIGIRNLASVPFGIAAFMGAKGRFGWYSRPEFAGSSGRQFPEWIGNQWNLEAGQGPYVVAPVIGSGMPDIVDEFETQLRLAAQSLGLDWD